jgi:hypothetical protein
MVLLSAGVSCSSRLPAFNTVTARVVVFALNATGGREERLSLFASIADGDGVDDIEYLYLVNDADELSWTLDNDSWVKHDEGSSVWIGSNGLRSPDGTIPRGQYRAILVDKAGERTERAVTVSAPETRDYALPTAKLDSGYLEIKSPYKVNTALFLDAGGNVVASTPVSPGKLSLDSLLNGRTWRSSAYHIAVYGFDPKAETGFMSWKIRLQE